MVSSGSLKNPIPLYHLLRKDVKDFLDGQIFLLEDIYFKDTLIIKSGAFLDDKTIYRLINFGIRSVKILIPEKESKKATHEGPSILNLKKQFLGLQKCLIADKDGAQINQLIGILEECYINEANVAASNNSIPVNKLIQEKKPRYIFVDLNLYPKNGLKVLREIREYTNADLFLTAMVDQSKHELIHKLKYEVDLYNATLLFKPVSETQLKLALLNSITNTEITKFLTVQNYLKKKSKLA